MITQYKRILIPILSIIIIAAVSVLIHSIITHPPEFDAQRAYNNVKYQLELGPRTMGSTAHDKAAQWIIESLKKSEWNVQSQESVVTGHSVKNIIARRGTSTPWILLGSHYDSRSHADQDPNLENRTQPVPGANDGASTVAILLELARVIPTQMDKQIWLVFFDNEDNGNSSGEEWSIGAQFFVSQLDDKPDRVVILDMLGDKNLQVYMEQNSNREINKEIWGVAKELGYTQFIPVYRHSVIDDHLPFIDAGIKAVDVIDIDYPYWHTTQDTLDKISANSLKAVGDTILKWLETYPN